MSFSITRYDTTSYNRVVRSGLKLPVISQRLGGTLEFVQKINQFINSRIGNELLVGVPPRKGWEQYYAL